MVVVPGSAASGFLARPDQLRLFWFDFTASNTHPYCHARLVLHQIYAASKLDSWHDHNYPPCLEQKVNDAQRQQTNGHAKYSETRTRCYPATMTLLCLQHTLGVTILVDSESNMDVGHHDRIVIILIAEHHLCSW